MVETVTDMAPRDQGSIIGMASSAIPSVIDQISKSADTLGIGNSDAIKDIGANLTGQKKRIKTAIALHTANTQATNYSIEYAEDEMQTFAMGLAAAGGTAALAKAYQTGGKDNVIQQGKGSTLPGAGAAAASVLLGASTGVQKLTGLAPNPRKEQIFKSVGFRKFQFDYEFFPRDAKEAENVLNIIYQFKLHMHPEFKDANQFLYIYPSEFDIFYYSGGVENLNLNRQTSAVLTDMSVNYAPQGQFTTFPGGMPTQINISLQFTELSTLTKEKIMDGM